MTSKTLIVYPVPFVHEVKLLYVRYDGLMNVTDVWEDTSMICRYIDEEHTYTIYRMWPSYYACIYILYIYIYIYAAIGSRPHPQAQDQISTEEPDSYPPKLWEQLTD